MEETAIISQTHVNFLISKMYEFKLDDRYCDVTLRVGAKSFKCHRLVLRAVCTYFDTMFNYHFLEGEQEEITLEDFEASIFEKVLQFIYTGKTSIDASSVSALLSASDFYGLCGLEKLCFWHIKNNYWKLKKEDVLSMFLFVRATLKTELIDFLAWYICIEFDYFSKMREFLKITFEDLRSILSSKGKDSSCDVIRPEIFLMGIIRWVEGDSNTPNHPTEGKRINHFLDNVKNIKFESELSEKDSNIKVIKQFLDSLMVRTDMRCLYHVMDGIYRCPLDVGFVWIRDYMRKIVLGDHLYFLNYSGNQNIFSRSSYFSLFTNNHLQLPSNVRRLFDVCKEGGDICAYNVLNNRQGNLEFKRDRLTHESVFHFNIKGDQWITLPFFKTLFYNENVVPFIKDVESNEQVHAYDTGDHIMPPPWKTLKSTIYTFGDSTSCAYNEKIVYDDGIPSDPTGVCNINLERWQRNSVLHMNFGDCNTPQGGTYRYRGYKIIFTSPDF